MIVEGEVYNNSQGCQFQILNYLSRDDIIIRFLETGYIRKTTSDSIRKKYIKDKMSPHIYGVGYIGDGKYTSTFAGSISKSYQVWVDMIKRCYCSEFQKSHPTYVGCEVDRRWHNFQTFAEWFYDNYRSGLHLDKDIKYKGNKIYSDKTCIFVTRMLNSSEAHSKDWSFLSPMGERVEFSNLNKFCSENGLNHSNMSAVYHGRVNSHKGWRA